MQIICGCAEVDDCEVSHEATGMSVVWDPTKWFCESVTWIEIPVVKDMWIDPSDFQSDIAKLGIATCQERSVGATASMIFFVD